MIFKYVVIHSKITMKGIYHVAIENLTVCSSWLARAVFGWFGAARSRWDVFWWNWSVEERGLSTTYWTCLCSMSTKNIANCKYMERPEIHKTAQLTLSRRCDSKPSLQELIDDRSHEDHEARFYGTDLSTVAAIAEREGCSSCLSNNSSSCTSTRMASSSSIRTWEDDSSQSHRLIPRSMCC